MYAESPTQAPPDPDLEQVGNTYPTARRGISGMMVVSGDRDSPHAKHYMRLIRQILCLGGTQYVEWE